MDFSLTEDQSLLKDSVARFIEREYSFDQRRKLVSSGGGFSETNWHTFAEMGWLMVALPEEHGGLGFTAVESSIIMEEFGKGLVAEPLLPVAILAARALVTSKPHGVAVHLLLELGAGNARPILAHSELGAF